MKPVYVSAILHAAPGRADDLEKALRDVMPAVRAEEGCIRYDLHRGLADQDTFLFYELWTSAEALDAHMASPHMAAMRTDTADMQDRPAEVLTWAASDVAE